MKFNGFIGRKTENAERNDEKVFPEPCINILGIIEPSAFFSLIYPMHHASKAVIKVIMEVNSTLAREINKIP